MMIVVLGHEQHQVHEPHRNAQPRMQRRAREEIGIH
jgi:hypothetical protein